MLLTKIPAEIRLIATRKAPGEDLDLETLQTVLEEELVGRERSHDPTRDRQTSLGYHLPPLLSSQGHNSQLGYLSPVVTVDKLTRQVSAMW